MILGWMITTTTPKGIKAMPTSPDVLDVLPAYLHKSLPTLGGVWNEEDEALDAWGTIPDDMRDHFQVTPVSVTIMNRGM
jgi:hypothetical protein